MFCSQVGTCDQHVKSRCAVISGPGHIIMMAAPKVTQYRSAITGRFVRQWVAVKYPATTVKETVATKAKDSKK